MKKSSSFKIDRFGDLLTEVSCPGVELVPLSTADLKSNGEDWTSTAGFELDLSEEVELVPLSPADLKSNGEDWWTWTAGFELGLSEVDEINELAMEGENFGRSTELGKDGVVDQVLEVSSCGVSLNGLVTVSTSESTKEGDNSVNS